MQEPVLQIDRMTEKDIDEAVDLISHTMNPDEGKWAERTMQFHFQSTKLGLADGRHYFVWRHRNKTKGIVGLHHYIWGPENNVWLAWFAVHPDCRRMGIGTKLLKAVEKTAVELGYWKFFVETYRHSDFDAARAFYLTNGFSQVGHIDDYLPDGSQMVVYGKTIRS